MTYALEPRSGLDDTLVVVSEPRFIAQARAKPVRELNKEVEDLDDVPVVSLGNEDVYLLLTSRW